jgi:hypothetical protein
VQADPGVDENVPAAHSLQSALNLLSTAEDVLTGQLAQTVKSVTVLDIAPGRAYLPGGQETVPVLQVALERPDVEPNVPASHRRQVILSDVYDPGGH